MSSYRIVTDAYSGYEVQVRRWWWPIWAQVGFSNTHAAIGKAEKYAEDRRHAVKFRSRVVKTLEDK